VVADPPRVTTSRRPAGSTDSDAPAT
jgi:hypothetical protein